LNRPSLSIAIIARDEEGTLPALFRSLDGLAAQRVLVDTGSRDGTKRLAEGFGAEVHDFAWTGDFSAARNHCLSLADGDWILWLDADDELTPAAREWLAAHLPDLDPGHAFAFRVRSPGPDGSETAWSQIRLIPNGRRLEFRNPIHETLSEAVAAAGLSVRSAPAEILHTGYRDAAAVERKRTRNRALLEKALTSPSAPVALWLAQGRMKLADGDAAAAEAAFRKALAGGEASRDVTLAAHVGLGQSLCFQDRAGEALEAFLACPQGSSHAPWLLECGKALWLAGLKAEARGLWTKCLHAGPEYGGVPYDWDGTRGGAAALLEKTRDPSIPERGSPPPAETPAPRSDGGGPRMDLSICTILKDEAANLPGLLACMPLGRAEWIVVDTGSADGTVEALLQAGIQPRTFAWRDDFSAARNESLRAATRGWILWLDADDRLPEGFWDALAPLLDGPKRAYRFVVRSPRENSRGECFRQIRLFPNHLGAAFEGRIHEQLGTSLGRLKVPIAEAELEILHLGYDTPAKRGAKLKRNRALLEKERLEHPRDPVVILEYGNCLYQSGEYPAAIEAYLALLPGRDPRAMGEPPADEALRHFPVLIAETWSKQGRDDQAEEWFRLAARWNLSDPKPLYWLGKRALASDNLRGALEFLYAALDRPVTVGRVATDAHTVRRNALGLVVLCELQLFGAEKAPRAREALRELIAGGVRDFPLERRVAWDFFKSIGCDAEAERYARAWLDQAPGDIALWEDLLESLYERGKHREVLGLFDSHPALRGRSGLLEAFRGKCGEAAGRPMDEIYALYRDAVRKFPEDPTLLVYFSEFVNHNRLYARCYADLKTITRPSETVRDFLRQMEALGFGAGSAAQSP
jgi:glycosyltransferase involved in cell wall biosynthesis